MKTVSCMNIDPEILQSFGAEMKYYKPHENIYREADHAAYYFQIIKGKIKLNSYNEEGREFIHNIIGERQSFGDAMLFIEKYYVMNAVSLTESQIIRLPKNNFLELLKKNPELSLEMNACLSQRLYFKAIMLQNMSSQNPVVRLEGLLNYLKSYHEGDCEQCFPVELTRQQLANLTGLRVETVIRSIKKMEKQGKLTIKDRKILY